MLYDGYVRHSEPLRTLAMLREVGDVRRVGFGFRLFLRALAVRVQLEEGFSSELVQLQGVAVVIEVVKQRPELDRIA